MDFWYNGTHSIEISGHDTWIDWHLIPAGKPIVAPPPLVENYIDVPGMNGKLDLTETLTGYPLYQMRTGDISFVIVPDGDTWSGWTLEEAYRQISNLVHGRRVSFRLMDDPNWVYYGRVTLGDLQVAKEYNMITLTYALDPLRERTSYFNTGATNNGSSANPYHTVSQSWVLNLTLPTFPGVIMPEIESNAQMTVESVWRRESNDRNEWDTTSTTVIYPNRARYPGILLREGENRLTFTGSGRVWVYFKELSL